MADTLEEMVVRLTGEDSEYQRMIQGAVASTQEAAKHIEQAADQVTGFLDGIKGFASGLVSLLASVGAADWLRDAFNNFAEAENISIRLDAILEANGRNVAEVRKEYDQFAATMQRLTIAEDDSVLALLQVAENMDVTGDAAKRAVKNALAMASAFGGSAETFVRMTAGLEKGVVSPMLSRYFQNLRAIKDPTEKAAKAQELLGKMFAVAQAEAGSAAGMVKTLVRDFGNMLEVFGEIVAQGVRPVIVQVKSLIAWFAELGPMSRRAIVIFMAAIAAVGPVLLTLGLLGPTIVTGFLTGLGIVKGGYTKLIGFVLAVVAPVLKTLGSFALALLNPFAMVMLTVRLTAAALMLYFGPIANIVKWVIWIGAALAVWVQEVGGVEAALGIVAGGFKKLAAFIRPVLDALGSLFRVIGAGALSLFLKMGRIQLDWMRDLASKININFTGIRDGLVTVIKFIELLFRNIGTIAAAVFGPLKSLIGGLVESIRSMFGGDASAPAQTMSDRINSVVVAVRDFLAANIDAIGGLALIGVAIYTSITAYNLLGAAIAFLRLNTIATWVASVLWAGAVWLATAAVNAWTIACTVATGIGWLLSTMWTVGAAGLLIFKAVAWGVVTAITGIGLANQFAFIMSAGNTAATLIGTLAYWGYLAAVYATTAVIWLLKAALFVLNLLTGGTTLAMLFAGGAAGTFSFSALAAKVATWLWNAALTVANALLTVGIGVVIALAVALVALVAIIVAGAAVIGALVFAIGAVFTVLAAAALTAFNAARDLFGILREGATTEGPLQAIGALIGQWGQMLKEVALIARTDMDAAWRLLVAGFAIAVEQIRQLWGPLWEYIKAVASASWELVVVLAKGIFADFWDWLKSGFAALWDWTKTSLIVALKEAVVEALGFIIKKILAVGGVLPKGLQQAHTEAQTEVAKAGVNAQAAEARQAAIIGRPEERAAAIAKAQAAIAEAGEKFRAAREGAGGLELQEAEAYYNLLREEAMARQAAVAGQENLPGQGLWNRLIGDPKALAASQEAAKMAGEKTGAAFGAGLQKTNAIGFNTAEALSRILKQREMTGYVPGKHIPRYEVTQRDGAVAKEEKGNALLKDIKDAILEQNKRPVLEVEPAALA